MSDLANIPKHSYNLIPRQITVIRLFATNTFANDYQFHMSFIELRDFGYFKYR